MEAVDKYLDKNNKAWEVYGTIDSWDVSKYQILVNYLKMLKILMTYK